MRSLAVFWDFDYRYASMEDYAVLWQQVIGYANNKNHRIRRWLWITCRPDLLAKIHRRSGQPWPRNVLAGTTLELQEDIEDVRKLVQVGDEHTVRFAAVLRQEEYISLKPYLPKLQWVVQGGNTRRVAYPFNLEWARKLRDECKQHGVAYNLQRLSMVVVDDDSFLSFNDEEVSNWDTWPADIRVREYPEVLYTS